jgi:2-C-methyl-D-erythritol 4-phosphate cytidylyltransferase
MAVIALIVAGGRGERMGASLPKQYMKINGEPIIRKTISVFLAHPNIDAVQVVIHPDNLELYNASIGNLKLLPPIYGGKTRAESVYNGLTALKALNPTNVLIHDAARPFIASEVIDRVLEAFTKSDAVIAGIPVKDTLKLAENNQIKKTINRTNLYQAQTPQGFNYEAILNAYGQVNYNDAAYTDDASIFEALNLPIIIVEGDELNFKITTKKDLELANLIVGKNG